MISPGNDEMRDKIGAKLLEKLDKVGNKPKPSINDAFAQYLVRQLDELPPDTQRRLRKEMTDMMHEASEQHAFFLENDAE